MSVVAAAGQEPAGQVRAARLRVFAEVGLSIGLFVDAGSSRSAVHQLPGHHWRC